MLYSIGVEFLA